METKIFPALTVRTKEPLQSAEEENKHKKQEAEKIEVIKPEILGKGIIGILEIKRYCESSKKTTDWSILVIAPDADKDGGNIYQKVCSILLENRNGLGEDYVSNMNVIETGGSTPEQLKKLFEEFVQA